jgi:alkyl hydroperoxide reductase subunit AhpC
MKFTMLSVLAMGVLLLAGCEAPPKAEKSEARQEAVSGLSIGAPLPDFELTTYSGESHRLSEWLDGEHFTVVIFHSPTCPCARNCAEAMVDAITPEAYPDVRFLGILPEPNWDADWMRQDLEAQQESGLVNYPVVIDRDQAVMQAWGVERVPTVFVADKQGRLRYWGAPESTLEPGLTGYNFLLKDALDALRAGGEPKVTHFDSIGCLIGRRQEG